MMPIQTGEKTSDTHTKIDKERQIDREREFNVQIDTDTGCSLNIVFFSLKSCDFSKLCQFCCRAGARPATWGSKREVQCTHTDIEGKPTKARVWNIF